jgi:hypothetical protein
VLTHKQCHPFFISSVAFSSQARAEGGTATVITAGKIESVKVNSALSNPLPSGLTSLWL